MKTSDDGAGRIRKSSGPRSGGVRSPCRRNCCLDESDVCMGCGRSIDEILRWNEASDTEREEILRSAERRRREDGPVAPR
jgi:predicted Fe-S protein YdhL (DUF1289 family)